jgi:mannose-6-phosphate isomerase-like protein (cupin superfamily)
MSLTSTAVRMFRLTGLFLSVLAQGGCKQTQQAEKTPLLPEAGPNEQQLSPYQPQNPYTELGKGILTRTVFETDAGSGLRVEVRDLLVGPGQSSASVSLPGAAVFEVRLGSGTLAVGGASQELRTGSTLHVAEGQAFVINNKAETPIAIRVYLVRATQ